MFRRWICFALVWLTTLSAALARNVIECESRYLGDGWFQYSVRTLPDPFFKGIWFSQVIPYSTNTYSFPGFLEAVPPAHWTNMFVPDWNGIGYDFTITQPRTNETTFLVHSSETHFKRGRCLETVYLEFVDNYYELGGLGGYVSQECLVPCTAEEADGSPSKLTTYIELVKDITIDALVRTNHQVYGLTFSWQDPSTVQLEASHNLKDWNFVARIFGDPPQTTWTTNVSLNSYGKFFRLSWVANRHLTDSTLNRAAAPALAPIEVRNYKIAHGRVQGEFISAVGITYTANLCQRNGDVIETQQITATNTLTTVSFPLRMDIGGVIRVSQTSQ